MELVIGGTAAVFATFFTNPLEVLKTRMQLQGELKSKGQHAVYYKNVLHAGYVVAKNDGVLALQKGLLPGLGVQFVMNGIRLGIFQMFEKRGYLRNKNGDIYFVNSVMVGGFGAILGLLCCSPLYLVKTHLQAQAAATIAVGHQHHHSSTWSALKMIYSQHGVKGLFKGASSSIPRSFVGSISQLLSFEYIKGYLNRYSYFDDKFILKSFVGSMVGGVACTVMMNPFDLIMTRLYNQPVDDKGKGRIYSSYMDCVNKIYKLEGFVGFFKGTGPNYLRIGPHTVLCLVFWDELKRIHDNFLKDGKTMKK